MAGYNPEWDAAGDDDDDDDDALFDIELQFDVGAGEEGNGVPAVEAADPVAPAHDELQPDECSVAAGEHGRMLTAVSAAARHGKTEWLAAALDPAACEAYQAAQAGAGDAQLRHITGHGCRADLLTAPVNDDVRRVLWLSRARP